MKKTLIVTIATLAFALQASALDIKAITSKPTAHNPQYKDKKAWPDLVGDEYFLKQKWEKARLLIWAHGNTKPTRGKRLDPMEPASWIDAATGKPADALPDMNTDVILPDSDKKYKVEVRGKTSQRLACRHLTVGRNAQFFPGNGGNFLVTGNIWVRPGAIFFVYRALVFAGNNHTFIRRDWPADGKLKKMHDTGAVARWDPKLDPQSSDPWMPRGYKLSGVSYFCQHDKPEGSTEVVGYITFTDEFGIKSGTFIVGRDSRYHTGVSGSAHIANGARIAVMDGGMFGGNVNICGPLTILKEGGSLTGGLPGRPLKRDARTGVGYSGRERKGLWGNRAGADALLYGDVIGYIAPGSNAKFLFGWHRIEHPAKRSPLRWKDPNVAKAYLKIERRIKVRVGPATKLENVCFEDLHLGGLMIPKGKFKGYKKVTFGAGCASKDPAQLFKEYEAKKK